MTVEFRPVRLAGHFTEGESLLVFRNDELAAVISRLGAVYDELAGKWFVEACFDGACESPHRAFDDLAGVEEWINSIGSV